VRLQPRLRAPTRRLGVGGAVLALGLVGSSVQAADLYVNFTPEYASGHYGNPTRTVTLSAPLDLRLEGERASIGLRIPYLAVNGPSSFVPRIGELGEGTDPRGSGTTRGLGNLRLGAAYTLLKAGDSILEPYLGVAVQLRAPTAAPPGLGSAQYETFLRLDVGANLTETLSLDLSVGRRFVPFPMSGGAGADYWTFFATLAHDLTSDWSIGISLDAQNRVPEANRPVLEAGLFVERAVTPNLTLGAFLWRGFTAESADYSFGLRVSYRMPVGGSRLAP
jgi:hypothetical protein